MLYRTFEIDEFLNKKNEEIETVDLMENNGAFLKLISLKKHTEIEPHTSNTDACIYVTDGEIEMMFSHEDDCSCRACGCALPDEHNKEGKKYKIKEDQFFFFEKGVLHSVKALKDTKFLLIKI